MTRQNDINSNMRGILVDWLVEVSEEYKLHTETLFLSINYIDRFLSRNNVQRGKLQLVGITCMLVAAKYEEIYPPSVEDFVYISDNAYSREQVIAQSTVWPAPVPGPGTAPGARNIFPAPGHPGSTPGAPKNKKRPPRHVRCWCGQCGWCGWVAEVGVR